MTPCTPFYCIFIRTGSAGVACRAPINKFRVKNIGLADCAGFTQWVMFFLITNSRYKIRSAVFQRESIKQKDYGGLQRASIF